MTQFLYGIVCIEWTCSTVTVTLPPHIPRQCPPASYAKIQTEPDNDNSGETGPFFWRLALGLVSTVAHVHSNEGGGEGGGILFYEHVLRVPTREDWMIYRGPGFLAVIWFGSMPCPFPPQKSASCLSFSGFCVSPVKLTDGKGWGERMVVEPNHSIAQESLAV